MRIDCCVSYFQKQLIGLLPNGQECLFYYSPDTQIYLWTIDGVNCNDPNAVNVVLNPYGYYFDFYLIPGETEGRFILNYVGTEPPTYLPIILDDNGDPVTYSLTNCCTKVCLEGTFDSAFFFYLKTGYGWNASLGSFITDFDATFMSPYIKSLYGQQTIYTANDNGDGTWYVKIDNAYICSPIAWSADDVTYQDMVACGTPICLFSTGIIVDSTGSYCFTDPTWDFNGQGVDFNAAAAIYGGYAVNDGDGQYLPYGGDTCSKVTFFYIGQSTPPAINIVDPIFGNFQQPLSSLYCSFGCVTTNSIYCKDLVYYGINLFGYINIPFTSYGASSIDLTNDLPGAEAMINSVLSKYCPGAYVNITDDTADYFTFTFNNVYYDPATINFQLFGNGGTLDVSELMIEC